MRPRFSLTAGAVEDSAVDGPGSSIYASGSGYDCCSYCIYSDRVQIRQDRKRVSDLQADYRTPELEGPNQPVHLCTVGIHIREYDWAP